MKHKSITFVIALVLISSLLLASCAQPTEAPAPVETEAPVATEAPPLNPKPQQPLKRLRLKADSWRSSLGGLVVEKPRAWMH